jgi:hypothetical protein
MYRPILCTAAGAVILAMPSKADETLKLRNVEHPTSNQNQQWMAFDERQFVGVVRTEGVATFPDGSTGKTVGVGTYDIIVGSGGTVNGYGTLTFTDGSELWSKYTGTLKWGNSKNMEIGTAIIIGGKGRYAGATGNATWEGEATRGANAVGEIDNVINIKK